jgi:hypothetical protein
MTSVRLESIFTQNNAAEGRMPLRRVTKVIGDRTPRGSTTDFLLFHARCETHIAKRYYGKLLKTS